MAGRYGLAGHARLLQPRHHGVAVDLRVQLDDVHEPRALVPLHHGRRRDALDVAEQRVVARGDRGARGEDLVEPLDLADADRRRHVVEPVVEAQPVVLEPVAGVGAPLVGEALQRRRAGRGRRS